MEEKKHQFKGNDLVVNWVPTKCIHSEKCWRGLPEVFKPKEKPWIQPDGVSNESIISQVKKCPSGALSIEVMGKNNSTEGSKSDVKIEIIPKGPLMLIGSFSIDKEDGSTESKEKAAFCRCGASKNKPYCDGSHQKVDFDN